MTQDVNTEVREEEGGVASVESMCPRCGGNGTTKILMLDIPHFREIVLLAFECPHCHERNSEVQFAGLIGERGRKYALSVNEGDAEALNRQLVKSDHATLRIPELDFEIEAGTQKAELTTVEGVLTKAAANLRAYQDLRRAQQPEVAEKIDEFCARLDRCAEAKDGFTLELDDPSGNSYVQSYEALPEEDAILRVSHYERTREQSRAIGLKIDDDDDNNDSEAPRVPVPSLNPHMPGEIAADDPYHGARSYGVVAPGASVARGSGSSAAGLEAALGKYTSPEEVMTFPGNCYACGASSDTRMFVTNIPFFGEVIIMANACDSCGYKNCEVKPGGGVADKGHTLTLRVRDLIDMNRDVIKSETATVSVPALQLETAPGTLGGLVTTVEGLLKEIKKVLTETQSFALGDSTQNAEEKSKWLKWLADFDALLALECALPFEVVIDDPLGHCFITPLEDDVANDDGLDVVDYERTPEQDEEYGIAALRQSEAEEAARAKAEKEKEKEGEGVGMGEGLEGID